MGAHQLLIIIAVVVIGGISLLTVSPSITEGAKMANVNAHLTSKHEALFQAICDYSIVNGGVPSTMGDLDTGSFFPAVNNNNGFGGTYGFVINTTVGTVTITTTVSDSVAANMYVGSMKNMAKPALGGGGVITTVYVLPTSVLHRMNRYVGQIPTQTVAPAAATNKYWYDTSGTSTVLKMSDGITWKPYAFRP